ncbi:MAG: hypothetical protein AAFU03_03490 [Bacteroidota bacterium]
MRKVQRPTTTATSTILRKYPQRPISRQAEISIKLERSRKRVGSYYPSSQVAYVTLRQAQSKEGLPVHKTTKYVSPNQQANLSARATESIW